MNVLPPCKTVRVHAFRGIRIGTFGQRLFQMLHAERNGRGPGPSKIDCLLFAGHTGISVDEEMTVYGFNPDGGAHPVWRVMQHLRSGGAYPGTVGDDTSVFRDAEALGLTVLRFDVALSPNSFRKLKRTLTAERKESKYSYGFPNGDGDCNCTTWLERLGLPLLTGRMDEFTLVGGVIGQTRRKCGMCT